MPRLDQLRHVAVVITTALFATLMLAAACTGHAPAHHGRTTVGAAVHTQHTTSSTTPSGTHDHHSTVHLDLAVETAPAGVPAPGAWSTTTDPTSDGWSGATARTADSRGPPTA